jgi:uncharacterized protein
MYIAGEKKKLPGAACNKRDHTGGIKGRARGLPLNIWERFRSYRSDAVAEFYSHIGPLLEDTQVQALDRYIQHHCFSRLSHSLDVAWRSFFIARILGWDSKSTARGGLLHDLFLYERGADEEESRHHLRNHPKVALENARRVCELNKVEENIIRRHMWLITLTPPRYRESYVVTFVDKYCALREAVISLGNRRRVAVAR